MDDRELLERAARAAGLPLGYADGSYFYCEHGPFGPSMYGRNGHSPLHWNPLTDDGDALRLAVKLGIGVLFDIQESAVYAYQQAPHDDHFVEWADEVAPSAATRRAIVRAAAELSRRG